MFGQFLMMTFKESSIVSLFMKSGVLVQNINFEAVFAKFKQKIKKEVQDHPVADS